MVTGLLLLPGFFLLVYGANKLVDGASSVARRYKIPEIVIGLTIVAFGTSAPELVVNIISAVKGNAAMALGNVVGSNIFNVLAILGIASFIYPLSVNKNTTWIEIPLSLMAGLVLFIQAADVWINKDSQNVISHSEGYILLLFFMIFMVYNLYSAKNGTNLNESDLPILSSFKSMFYIIIGLLGLVIGGQFVVNGAVSIAEYFNLSERIISITIVSIGTSLPELATSVVAARKKNVDMAIGNVVGSNIFNIFFIMGLSSAILPIPVLKPSFTDLSVNLISGILLFMFIFIGKGRRISKVEGILFLLVYLGYVGLLIYN